MDVNDEKNVFSGNFMGFGFMIHQRARHPRLFSENVAGFDLWYIKGTAIVNGGGIYRELILLYILFYNSKYQSVHIQISKWKY